MILVGIINGVINNLVVVSFIVYVGVNLLFIGMIMCLYIVMWDMLSNIK